MTSTDPEGDARRLCDPLRDGTPEGDELADLAMWRLSILLAEGMALPRPALRQRGGSPANGAWSSCFCWGEPHSGDLELYCRPCARFATLNVFVRVVLWNGRFGGDYSNVDGGTLVLDLDHPSDRAEVVAASLAVADLT